MIFSLHWHHLNRETSFTTIIIDIPFLAKYYSWWIILTLIKFICIFLSKSSTWTHSVFKFFIVLWDHFCLSEFTYFNRTLVIIFILNLLHIVFANEGFYLIYLEFERNCFLFFDWRPIIVIERLSLPCLLLDSKILWVLACFNFF
jgi:hypothetical protein